MNGIEILQGKPPIEDVEAWASVRRHIHCDPDVMDGLPVFRGTRVPVYVVLECLAEGLNAEEIVRSFPSLDVEQVAAALRFSVFMAALR